MCQAITCPRCGKPTWRGCGAHVEEILGDVPESERCQGHSDETSTDDRR